MKTTRYLLILVALLIGQTVGWTQNDSDGSLNGTETLLNPGDRMIPEGMTEFYASANERNVLLTWSTFPQVSPAGFEIEWSNDGLDWETLDYVPAAPYVNEPIEYKYYDYYPQVGANYYRLRQIDFDDDYAYSQMDQVWIANNLELEPFSFFPNPASTYVQLNINSDYELAVDFFNAEGKILRRVEGSNHQETVDISDLTPGIYFLRTEDIYGNTITKKLVKN